MTEETKNEMDSFKKASEDLILETAGYGYLKLPKEVRNLIYDNFGKKLKNMTSPEAFFEYDEEKKILKVLYRFDFENEELVE